MPSTLTQAPATTRLADLGAIRVQGADAVRFLQGQLSNDVMLLSPTRPLLAGFHNPQGRVIALLRLIAMAGDDVLAVLPRELAPPVAARLSKFVLRAKAKVTDASGDWTFTGVIAPDAPAGSGLAVRIASDPARWLIAAPAGDASPQGSSRDMREHWRALDIAAGMPQVYAATSEEFVAQRLNLDVVGAVSFTKGCYTGQEVIARAHYRGRVKRRMQRFRTLAPGYLAPGDVGTLRDGRSFRVVDGAALADGRCEFLAVTTTHHGEPGEAEPAHTAADTSAAAAVEAEQLDLPYELPA